jgi:hypothetical protein
MQPVSFSGIDDFLAYLPPEELRIVQRLRSLIEEAIPGCREKLSYNVPFYKGHSNICFIWPSSVPWGNMKQEGVRLGFSKGYLLDDSMGYLDRGTRKQVYCKDFYAINEIDGPLLLAYLHEAALLDQLKKMKK